MNKTSKVLLTRDKKSFPDMDKIHFLISEMRFFRQEFEIDPFFSILQEHL